MAAVHSKAGAQAHARRRTNALAPTPPPPLPPPSYIHTLPRILTHHPPPAPLSNTHLVGLKVVKVDAGAGERVLDVLNNVLLDRQHVVLHVRVCGAQHIFKAGESAVQAVGGVCCPLALHMCWAGPCRPGALQDVQGTCTCTALPRTEGWGGGVIGQVQGEYPTCVCACVDRLAGVGNPQQACTSQEGILVDMRAFQRCHDRHPFHAPGRLVAAPPPHLR